MVNPVTVGAVVSTSLTFWLGAVFTANCTEFIVAGEKPLHFLASVPPGQLTSMEYEPAGGFEINATPLLEKANAASC
jgi:hypothetical protein